MRARGFLTLVMIHALLALASYPAHAQEPTPTHLLGQTVVYWDLGLRLNYPTGWPAPQFIAGQVLLAPAESVESEGRLREVIVALRIVDPVRDFGMDKDVSFEQIALAVNIVPGYPVTLVSSGTAAIAGLEAGYANVIDEKRDLRGQTLAFRMPDGRAGALVGIAPAAAWADFAPTFDAMRGSAALVRPADFLLPVIGSQAASFAPGGITFIVPNGWIDSPLGNSARLYHDPESAEYQDNSGYTNGPQLVIRASRLGSSATLRDALTQALGTTASDIIQETRVGGQPALAHTFIDPQTWQVVTFVGFLSADGKTLNIFRWTRPGALLEVTRPIFEAILDSVQFTTAQP